MSFINNLHKVLFEASDGGDEMKKFAKKRHAGAEKISDAAKEKGGPAMLTYHHFVVKLPYYKKASEGKLDYDEISKEYKELCARLHEYMDDITKMNQTDFQKLVGRIEVIGELLIKKG